MKKAFTLIEIIITLVIIGIILSLVTSMGQGFSDRIRFANTKEETAQTINKILQEAATTNAVLVGSGWQKYGSITLDIQSGTTVARQYMGGELTGTLSRAFDIQQGNLFTSGVTVMLKPYAIGCKLDSEVSGFSLVSSLNHDFKACYTIDSDTCKLEEHICH